MLSVISPCNNLVIQHNNAKLVSQRLAVRTCLLKNQISQIRMPLRDHYKEITNMYLNMIFYLCRGERYYLMFPQYIFEGIIEQDNFVQQISEMISSEFHNTIKIKNLN